MSKKRWYKARPVAQKVTSEVTGLTYDSPLECELHEGVLKDFDKHPYTIDYTVSHKYHPDFCNDQLVIECKGFFQDSVEARKYKEVRKGLGDKELVFIFERPDTPLPWATKRKDGSRMTHKEWAEYNGFRAYGKDVTLEELLNDNTE